MHIIREWRKVHRINIAELAAFLGVSQPSMSCIELEQHRISGDLAIKVSQYTGIDLFTLRPDLKVNDAEIGKLFRLASERKNKDDK
ncbi:helix-turn-helix transcriptional regulator [Candidatus Sororendozoicomonas aggregata]|uniref:helix-turn-helix domain-containing protein n=1 Tax=Candidatus Sororendozoicomonas aggregata TaxID=3073239 RepID=UPI002ED43DD7